MNPESVSSALGARARLLERLGRERADDVVRFAARYVEVLRGGGTLFFLGNGGSAADAQHLATEYVVRFSRERPALRAVALTTDTSLLTACGNDLGFEHVFARQIEALARPGDLVIIHSTSGDSPNVIRAARAARAKNVAVVGFLGQGGGAVRKELDDVIVVPAEDTAAIQEAHLALEHIVAGLVEDALTR